MKNRTVGLLIGLIGIAFFAGGCNKQTIAPPETADAAEELENEAQPASAQVPEEDEETAYQVGFILLTREEDYYNQIGEAIMEKAQEMGVQAVISDGEGDAAIQTNHIENFAAMGYDAIAIAAADEATVAPAIEAAAAAGIPVFTFGVPCYSVQSVVCHVGTNNNTGGRMGAEEVVRLTEYGEIALITSSDAIESIDREQGFRAVMDSQVNVECVAYGDCEGNEQKAYDLMQNWLATHPELGAVFCTKDVAAQGALRAIKEAGSKAYVVGFDGTAEALAAVFDKEGDGKLWTAEVIHDTRKTGAVLTEQIKNHLDNGETAGKELLIDPVLADFAYIIENALTQ